jgi:hypothetical protein
MRHVWSLLAGIVITPLAWVLIALGQNILVTRAVTRAELLTGDDLNPDLIVGGAVLIGAGLLYGLIASLRVSPLGAMVAAFTYLGTTVWAVLSVSSTVRVLGTPTWELFGYPIRLANPIYQGTLPVVGGIMLIAIFSAKRWRAWPKPAAASTWPEPVTGTSAEPFSPAVPEQVGPAFGQPASPAGQPVAAAPHAGSLHADMPYAGTHVPPSDPYSTDATPVAPAPFTPLTPPGER